MARSFYEKLQGLSKGNKQASEEDVKDAYLAFLKLRSSEYTKNLIDIRINGDKIWVEAKAGEVALDVMFAQSLHYVHQALVKGEHLPSFLLVIDQAKVGILPYANIQRAFEEMHTVIGWGKSASDVKALSKADFAKIQELIAYHIIAFYFKYEGEEQKFLATFDEIKKSNQLTRTDIIPDNLDEAYASWALLVGEHLRLTVVPEGESAVLAESELTFLFYADLMHDGKSASVYQKELPASARLVFLDGQKIFLFDNNRREAKVTNEESYQIYWNRWQRPPKEQYRDQLISRRDALMPLGERRYDGEFYTPLKFVKQAYAKLAEILGKDWQNEYIVWDMACGTGNLEQIHEKPRNLFLSTLKQREVDIMKLNAKNSERYAKLQEATIWQYDYLNDDVQPDGTIAYTDYDHSFNSRTGEKILGARKFPKELEEAIKAGKKIVVLMNPPYGEAGTTLSFDSKAGIAKEKGVAKYMMKKEWGAASNELYAQFLVRIQKEMPHAIIAMFSKVKHINSPNFERFREQWQAKYLGGFVFHSRNFDTVDGSYPIAFLMWDLGKPQPITEIVCDVLDTDIKDAEGAISSKEQKKFFNQPKETYLNKWIDRPKANPNLPRVVPLKNALKVFTANFIPLTYWSDNAIGYIFADANDFQNAGRGTTLFSSPYGKGHGFYVNPDNLHQAAVVFAVRRAIRGTWLNDRDQFLQPTKPLTKEFELDCLVYMLFNGSNLSAGASKLVYQGQAYTLVNHFFPYSPSDVGGSKLESYFMVDYLEANQAYISAQAQAVLEAGKWIYQQYFKEYANFSPKILDEYKLGRSDVGWYQIKNSLKQYKGGKQQDAYSAMLEEPYKALTVKLADAIYHFGFLR
ncbi:hypothetical protein [Entomospira culicis]|uniref:Uncharacterized protein n=1 Tax=Entomospira culicis TaxID=2719989 RepID=A0A968GE35_9SPIO|nr:hypothetical protein [Entomospira culicis]NIZ18644.1 hypothetical protein [Entomospira culicis]NIZ68859.1 hypothetical protein [Entomospira culicis]WDI37453.1 hypothetical protein PVA46_01300 [Entomospira culicis]WDI39081.1 hypothetical protein PVA47_01305 [Entomospira culicis]